MLISHLTRMGSSRSGHLDGESGWEFCSMKSLGYPDWWQLCQHVTDRIVMVISIPVNYKGQKEHGVDLVRISYRPGLDIVSVHHFSYPIVWNELNHMATSSCRADSTARSQGKQQWVWWTARCLCHIILHLLNSLISPLKLLSRVQAGSCLSPWSNPVL